MAMDALYHQTNRLLEQVAGEELGRLEQTINAPNRQALYDDIQGKLRNVDSNCSRLDILVNKEPPARRSNAKYKVDQLKYDYRHILNAVQQIEQRLTARERQNRDREALLAHSFSRNDTAVQLDGLEMSAEHHGRLQSAEREVDGMLATVHAIMENLQTQGGTLKGAKKKVLDLMSTLGMSNTLMRLVERRGQQDKYILIGGMVVVLLFLYCLLRYFT